MSKTVLDEENIKSLTEGIRQMTATGLKPNQIKSLLHKSWQDSGLARNKVLTRMFDVHFEAALKRYQALPVKTEVCQVCGQDVPVCVPCSICGKLGCKSCTHVELIPSGLAAPKPVGTCKLCNDGG